MTQANTALVIAFVLALTTACDRSTVTAAPNPEPDAAAAAATPTNHLDIRPADLASIADNQYIRADGEWAFSMKQLDVWVRHEGGYVLWFNVADEGTQYVVTEVFDAEGKNTTLFFEPQGTDMILVGADQDGTNLELADAHILLGGWELEMFQLDLPEFR